ncbi:hypothetical protein QBE52_19230 [Clostridiaceae bacterium 35-E11]
MEKDIYMESLLDIPEEIYIEDFTSMEERLKSTEMEAPFQKLKKEVGQKNFEKYFNTLIQIKKHEKTMMIITKGENHRAIIMREYYDVLKQIFYVSNIIIVAQAL